MYPIEILKRECETLFRIAIGEAHILDVLKSVGCLTVIIER